MTPSPSVREDGVVPGPQDQLSEQRQADHVRPLERNPTIAALRERLERLPPNHPSSPHYDDGARKPPEPDPSTREVPVPRDPDDDPESAADRDLSGDDAPRIHPDGSWEWKGYTLTPEQSRCADLALARCRDAEGRDADGNYGEHGLTPAMRRIEAQLEHGKLAPDTEKFALKSADRFKEKLAKMIAVEPDKSAEELSNEIYDAIRYTFLLDRDYYLEAMQETISYLEEEEFELGVRKNTWESDEYKGVNTRWFDSEGNVRFEVQFHTEESFRIKQLTHDAYDRIHDLRASVEEREELRDYQRRMSAEIILPPGCEDIYDFRKDGW
jgi:hypothetical protein